MRKYRIGAIISFIIALFLNFNNKSELTFLSLIIFWYCIIHYIKYGK